MAIEYTREIPKERSATGERADGDKYSRAFYVRTSSTTESLVDVSNAPGVAYGDPHPDNMVALCKSYSIKAADDSGLLYVVSFEYEKLKLGDDDEEDPEDRPPVWSGTSSVTTGPVYKDKAGNVMTNSAGDPLEDLTKEFAEERLTLTKYYASHTDWMTLSRTYTNAINDDTWNGGAARSWKCQGCSKKMNIETKDGARLVYWEVTWEFAYRKDLWTLKPWDVGFNQLVDENGTPTMAGDQRATIKGQDGKGVRQPVALQNGMAKAAGEPPDALEFFVYDELDFMTPFGEVTTPV